jgi:hypothetical protein
MHSRIVDSLAIAAAGLEESQNRDNNLSDHLRWSVGSLFCIN